MRSSNGEQWRKNLQFRLFPGGYVTIYVTNSFDSYLSGRDERSRTIQRSLKTGILAVGNGTALFVEFKAARRKIESQLKQLAHVEEMVVSDPQIMRGTPV